MKKSVAEMRLTTSQEMFNLCMANHKQIQAEIWEKYVQIYTDEVNSERLLEEKGATNE